MTALERIFNEYNDNENVIAIRSYEKEDNFYMKCFIFKVCKCGTIQKSKHWFRFNTRGHLMALKTKKDWTTLKEPVTE